MLTREQRAREVGLRVQRARKIAGLSQLELARAVGHSTVVPILFLETGLAPVVDALLVQEVEAVTGVAILADESSPPPVVARVLRLVERIDSVADRTGRVLDRAVALIHRESESCDGDGMRVEEAEYDPTLHPHGEHGFFVSTGGQKKDEERDGNNRGDVNKPRYEPKAEDFHPTEKLLLGQGANRISEVAAAWGRIGLQKPPIEFAESVAAGTGLEVRHIQIEMDEHVHPEAGVYQSVKVTVEYLDGGERTAAEIVRTFFPGYGAMEHSAIGIRDDLQGRGLNKKLARNSMDEYRAAGIYNVLLNAGKDRGSATWAKYGWKPTTDSWNALRRVIADRANEMLARGTMNPTEHGRVQRLAANPDGSNLRLVARSLHGNRLLHQTGWRGILDLRDAKQMKVFDDYTLGGMQWQPKS